MKTMHHRLSSQFMPSRRDDSENARLLRIERKVDNATAMLNRIDRRDKQMVKTLADVSSQADALLDKVGAKTTLDESVATYVNGVVDQNKQLKADLDAAIAANDPAAIQAISDKLAAINDKMDADTVLNSINQNVG